MTEPTPEERLAALHAEAGRWANAADALVNASNAADEAAELLEQARDAFDSCRASPSRPAGDMLAELRSSAVRLGFAGEAARTRSDTARARIVPAMEAPT